MAKIQHRFSVEFLLRNVSRPTQTEIRLFDGIARPFVRISFSGRTISEIVGNANFDRISTIDFPNKPGAIGRQTIRSGRISFRERLFPISRPAQIPERTSAVWYYRSAVSV